MASSESEAKSESDVTPAGEENLDFEDEASCYSLIRSRCQTRKLFNVNLHCCKRTEFSAWMKIHQTPPFRQPVLFPQRNNCHYASKLCPLM